MTSITEVLAKVCLLNFFCYFRVFILTLQVPRPSDWSLLARTVVFHLNSNSSPISHSSRSLTPRAPYQIPGMVNVSFVKILPTLSYYVCCILLCIAYLLSRSIQVNFFDMICTSIQYRTAGNFHQEKKFSYQFHHLLSLVNL